MEGAKRISLGSRKKSKRKKRRFVRNIVAYLNSDDYLFAPLFSDSESWKANDISMAEALEMKRVKRRMSERVKEYLNSDYHMYGPMISSASSLKGKLQITNLVTMEVSTSTKTMREDNNNNYSNLRSDITEQTLLHNVRVNSPKQALVILGGQRTGLSPESDLSPREKNMGKPDQRRVTIE